MKIEFTKLFSQVISMHCICMYSLQNIQNNSKSTTVNLETSVEFMFFVKKTQIELKSVEYFLSEKKKIES